VNDGKDLWPAGTTDAQIVSTAEQAFKNNPRITGYDSQTNMLRAQSTVNGQVYEMMVNKGTGEVRSIYPKGGRR
jgi:competence protein ComGF